MASNIPKYQAPRLYNDGNSSIGTPLVDFLMIKKALIDMKKEQFFGQLADTTIMPKHYGKTMKKYHYIPLLDDRNINDQGIDATGTSVEDEVTIVITDSSGARRFAVGRGVDAVAALAAAKANAVSLFKNIFPALSATITYDDLVTNLTAAGWLFEEGPAVNSGGNLYGSSTDVGAITDKLPALSEEGGRVNRVGFTRLQLEASIENFGFFDEYTRDSVDFDDDAELMSHVARESLRGANEITEDMLQIDLLNAANVVVYGGAATSVGELTGNVGATPSELTYDMLQRIEQVLNKNRCPKDTTIITGSKMTDTRVVGASRYAYIGAELKTTLLRMKDFHNNAAFIEVKHYAEAGKLAVGEVGAIGNFRFIEVPKMLHWDGAGATVTSNDGYLENNGKYNVYPMLVVGSGSFSTIGFQSSGGKDKFEIIHVAPGSKSADRSDPYGKTGFYSIQWWYGTFMQRPEWIALAKVVAKK